MIDIINYIKENTVEKIDNRDDNFGLGQIVINDIYNMIKIKDKYNLEFTFTKQVTALSDINYVYKTIIADPNYLFVFCDKDRSVDLHDFWKDVDKLNIN